jgi:integrase
MVAQKHSIKVVLHKHKAKDSHGYLYLRVKVPGEKKYKNKALGYKIPEKLWDSANQLIKRGFPDYETINDEIHRQRLTFKKSLDHDTDKGKLITEHYLSERLTGKKYSPGSFIAHFEQHIDYLTAQASAGYVSHWKVEYRRLVRYAGDKLAFEDINRKWLEKYVTHMSETLNIETTLPNKIKKISELINKAVDMGDMKREQIAGYKFPSYKAPVRNYLTLDETDKIWELVEKGEYSDQAKMLMVAVYFLVECYSGIRFSDWPRFKVEKLIHEDNLKVRAKKNGEPVYLPLRHFPRLAKVLDYIKCNNIKFIHSEKETNIKLKTIGNQIDVDFKITTHTGRHTCGTLLGELGYAAKDIAEVLGISENTAKVYIKQTRKGLLTTLERFGGL